MHRQAHVPGTAGRVRGLRGEHPRHPRVSLKLNDFDGPSHVHVVSARSSLVQRTTRSVDLSR